MSGVAGSLVTVLAGIFLAASPDSPSPSASISWITAPWSLSSTYRAELLRQSATLERALQAPEVSPILSELSGYGDLTIYVVTITNNTERVSKELLVTADRAVLAAVSKSQADKMTLVTGATPARIASLAPSETARIVLVTKELLLSDGPSVRILHDGRRIHPAKLTITKYDDPFGLMTLAVRYSPWSTIALAGFIVIVLALLCVSIWLTTISNNFPALVKQTTDKELERTVRFADFIRKNHANKLPETLRASPSSEPTNS